MIKTTLLSIQIRFSLNGFLKEFYLYNNLLSTCPEATHTSYDYVCIYDRVEIDLKLTSCPRLQADINEIIVRCPRTELSSINFHPFISCVVKIKYLSTISKLKSEKLIFGTNIGICISEPDH